jgi:sialate O-acetylesterase
MKIMNVLIVALVATMVFVAGMARAEVIVDPMFSDNMVLQREMKVPVWGTAAAGENVTVTFRGQTVSDSAGTDGKWMLHLDPLKVGDASELTVKGSNELVFKNVVVGEVWVASGQSNMAIEAKKWVRLDLVLKEWVNESIPDIRLYTKQGWKSACPLVNNEFSGLGYAFAYSLYKELKIPVGIMAGAKSGRPSGMFLSPEMALASPDPDFKKFAEWYTTVPKNEVQKVKVDTRNEHQEWNQRRKKAQKAHQVMFDPPPQALCELGYFYDRLVKPFAPYGIRGVLWDQGESRTAIPDINQYVTMQALIAGWRNAWGQGDFPFLHIQKPSGGGLAWDPKNPVNKGCGKIIDESKVAPLKSRDMGHPLGHIRMGTLKNAPLVTSSDLAPAVHPFNKSGYATRSVRVALGDVYGREIETCGPVYKSHKIEGNRIRISYDHVGTGLAWKHGKKLQGFEISGVDGKWQWADAKIDGDTVVLSSGQVKKPVKARYAFRFGKINFANLFNKDGLPALMFIIGRGDGNKGPG